MTIHFSRTLGALEAESTRPALATLLAVCLFIVGGLSWLLLARVGVYETSRTARLESRSASHVIQAPVRGEISISYLILARTVRAQETLVVLDSSRERLELEVERARHAACVREISGLEGEISAQANTLASERRAGSAAVREARSQADAAMPLSRFADDELARMGKLREKGVISEVDYLHRRSEAERDRLNERSANLAVTRVGAEMSTRQGDRLTTIEQLRHDLQVLEGQRATSEVQITRLEFEVERRTIKAPVDGVVGDLTVLRPGAYVDDGAILATIVPTGELQAVAEFPAGRAMGRIRAGQEARLRLEGFPWGQYGSILATVRRVAAEGRQGVARVELDFSRRSPLEANLQHGLSASVDIEVERVHPAMLLMRALGRLAAEQALAADTAP